MLKKYNSMSAAELKEVLRANEQQLTGNKAELVACCIDGELHGGLPICPNCERGRLHAPGEDGVYTCPGKAAPARSSNYLRPSIHPHLLFPRVLGQGRRHADPLPF